ncbi:hypothetical protein ABPG75_001639 [Micractinium tetrahymenae]
MGIDQTAPCEARMSCEHELGLSDHSTTHFLRKGRNPPPCLWRALNCGKLATPRLRPCEHQVAGHLFEDGKAGSLIDDRGHFYKPLQRGPRGDRERAFYAVIAALLQDEVETAAEAAAEAAAERQQQPLQRGGGRAASGSGSEGGSPPVCLNGGSPSSSPFSAWQRTPSGGEGSPAVKLPWKSAKQLMDLFPSFKSGQRERGPMEVMQRDEIGLLSTQALYGGSPTSSLDHEEALQQAQDCACSRPCSARSAASGEGEGEAGSQRLALRYGKSPDSDDCSEQTGRRLMQAYCCSSDEGMLGSGREPPGAGGAEAAAAAAAGAPATGGVQQQERAAAVDQQQQQRAAPQPHQVQHHAAPHHHLQQQPVSLHQQHQQRQQQAPAWQHPHTTASAEEAYTQPEHAQVAALLGQPVYDLDLSGLHVSGHAGGADGRRPGSPAAAPAVVPSSSKPHRSPFMSDLLHHTHPPGPQERRGSAAEGQPPAAHSSGSATAAAGQAGGAASAPLPGCAGPSGRSSEACWVPEEDEAAAWEAAAQGGGAAFGSLPFSVRNAPLLRVIPKYYGTAQHPDGRALLELEDLASAYRHPCIVDIKVGFRTWYPGADPAYIQRCRDKDASTTQAALGFKICGMQVFRHGAGGYWRASKRWCKTLPAELVDKALHSFAHNEHGLRPSDVYGGPGGAIAQLEALESWFAMQRDFHFYSSSVLVLYEGGAASPEGAKVRVRLVDFAHTFFQGEALSRSASASDGGAAPAPERPAGSGNAADLGRQRRRRDTNFLAGLRALLARLRVVVHAQLQAELT